MQWHLRLGRGINKNMLSREDNELLTRVGPKTPMGELLRRFWTPALLSEELPRPDCDPINLRLLGEDLVCFRDSNGEIGFLDSFCPHRRANLFFGRNEECGLRCVYHGWKFDVAGNCVDMPSEPDDTNFKNKIKITSYPSVERGGVIYIYMGPSVLKPQPPELEWAYLPKKQRTATKRLQQNNWVQAVEGGIDSSHISFLHSRTDNQANNKKSPIPRNKYHAQDRHPVFEIEEMDYGLRIAARRNAGSEKFYWRITQYLYPYYTMIPPVGDFDTSKGQPYAGHAWVPIDDENTWTWSFGASPEREYTKDERKFSGGKDGMWGPTDENYYPLQNRDNNYLIDREVQRTRSFTGINGIPNQDAAVQESMGSIVDRSKEKLGTSDAAIIAFRKSLIKLAKAVAEGKEPAAALDGQLYNVRSVSVVLDKDKKFAEGAKHLFSGGQVLSAAE
ncbi:MAG: Rieske 2Fe-2S domain-containing protein [Pseudomonadota bacterium]|nr:Rieske 2Fe-2S domain-containing protein [Pseudomonadota bacterium]